MSGQRILFWSLSTVFLAGVWLLGYRLERSDFGSFLAVYTLLFVLYFLLIGHRTVIKHYLYPLLGLGVLLRILLLFSFPHFSDDIYRFLWDGRLTAHGFHPFAHVPAFYMDQPVQIPGITPELFQRLNSPAYYTVYPPVCQGVFWLAGVCFPLNMIGGVFILKLFLLACESGTILLLGRRLHPGTGLNAGVLYALNPLILLEISGNCHFEGAMTSFLLAGCLALLRQRLVTAAGYWALATASKLIPLLFLPIVWAQLGWKKGLRFMTAFALISAVLFAPLLQPAILRNMASSLHLYFRQFEFNASLYYLLKQAGLSLLPPKFDVGRALGPTLGLLVIIGVLWIAWQSKPVPPAEDRPAASAQRPLQAIPLLSAMVLASTLHLVLATTVHPWYIALPFALSLNTRWRYPLVWTAAAGLSYSHYAGGGFQEQYGWIALEYTLVALAFIADLRSARPR